MEATIQSPVSVAAGYKARLSAEPTSKTTSIVALNLNETNTARAADFINTLVALYNEDANNDKNEVASKTAEFIDGRIQIINKELGTTEAELASYKQQAGLTDLTSDAQLALQEKLTIHAEACGKQHPAPAGRVPAGIHQQPRKRMGGDTRQCGIKRPGIEQRHRQLQPDADRAQAPAPHFFRK